MDFWLSITQGNVGASPSGVIWNLNNHLLSPQESGCFARLPDSRDEQGRIRPHFHNLPLWKEVGYVVGQNFEDLIRNLTMGMDRQGNQLTRTDLFRAPAEAIITLPSEVSQALAHNPTAAIQVLWVTASVYVREIERAAISVRCGGRQTETYPAQTLSLTFFHALSNAREPHLHAHTLTFSPAIEARIGWHAYVNRRFIEELHQTGGARDLVTRAGIEECARHKYKVEYHPGKSNPDLPHGAKVTCPDGVVIEPGSIPRSEGARVQAREALWYELGTPCLTNQELQLLLGQVGDFPVASAGGQRQVQFLKKLKTLNLLEESGRVRQDLLLALAEIDLSMAIVEASLRDLPLLDSERAAFSVRERREELLSHVPGVRATEWKARHIWTLRYDDLLQIAASEDYEWALLPGSTQKGMYLLEKAGIILKHWERGWPSYRLTHKGEERRLLGLREVEELKGAVPELFRRVSVGQPPPDVIVGRLQCAGVHVSENALEFRSLGRVTDAEEKIRESGIVESTLATPDLRWWQEYWEHRSDLAPILARVVLRPEELPSTMPGGLLDQQREAQPSAEEEETEPTYIEVDPVNRWDLPLSRVRKKSLEHAKNLGHEAPMSGINRVRNR